MRPRLLLPTIFTLLVASNGLPAQVTYPASMRQTVADTMHGRALTDPYRWLEDQQAGDTRAWIGEQNAFTDSVLAALPERDQISNRLAELLKVDVMSPPAVRGNRYFFSKRAADQDLFVIYMREGLNGEDIPLIDPNTMAAGVPLSANLMDISKDGTMIAYAVRAGGLTKSQCGSTTSIVGEC